jgi:hypothetical protein
MSDVAQVSLAELPPPPPPKPQPVPLLDRSGPLFALLLGVGLVVFVAAFLTVHTRPPEMLASHSGSKRAHARITHWLNDGYFHYRGMFREESPPDKIVIYRTSSGTYMVSAFILEKIFFSVTGRYSWRLAALHNEVISLLLSALLGMLAFRIARRLGLDSRLAFAVGASVVIVVFTFPDNLSLYWEMSSQAYFLLFATIFLLIEERCADGRRTLTHSVLQAVVVLLMTSTEKVAGLAFVGAMAVTLFLLEQRRGAWRRFLIVVVAPALIAVGLYEIQVHAVKARFPQAETAGSTLLFRSGLDGESLYYGDHLDIAWRRDVARGNWKANREYLFVWKWVFILGSIATLAVLAAYVARRAPRIAVETLTALAGAWVLYGAIFSQAFVIHPYLYDVLLFAPFVLALFAFVPALMESMTRRTGAVVMVVVFCACWYALFQMRLYALWYPMPGAKIGSPPVAASR